MRRVGLGVLLLSLVVACGRQDVEPEARKEVGVTALGGPSATRSEATPVRTIALNGIQGVVVDGREFRFYPHQEIAGPYVPDMDTIRRFERGLKKFAEQTMPFIDDLSSYVRQYGGVRLRTGQELLLVLMMCDPPPSWKTKVVTGRSCTNECTFILTYDPRERSYETTYGLLGLE